MTPKAVPRANLARRILLRIDNELSSSIRKVKSALNLTTEHHYGDISILLPADHPLPAYQERHPLYDRFLPHLGRYLDPGTTVIDVGANCGDTLAAMYSANKNLNYICVEPDEIFFGFLQRNRMRILAIDENASIQAIKALVGKCIANASLEGSDGTKHAIVGDSSNSMSSESLDHILSLNKAANIKLIKTDVDGFDYDVIDSAESTLMSCSPILFFECHFDHAFQKAGYEKTIANLQAKGYANWVIFDNFGEVILRTKEPQQINQLLDYVWRQNVNRTTRTIFYYDVLAATSRDSQLIDAAIEDYLGLN